MARLKYGDYVITQCNGVGFDTDKAKYPTFGEAMWAKATQKWYTSIPGTEIPVVHAGGFYVDAPNYAIVWAWNFLPEILAKEVKWIESGGKFIVPVPEVKIL